MTAPAREDFPPDAAGLARFLQARREAKAVPAEPDLPAREYPPVTKEELDRKARELFP